MIYRRLGAFALFFILIILQCLSACAAVLGPAETIEDLRAMLDEAAAGDTLLISGDIAMDGGAPLASDASVRVTSQSGEIAVLRGIRLQDASITFSDILFLDSLQITGSSTILLSRGVHVRGGEGQTALSFDGNGTLIIEPGCDIEGGEGGEGVSIRHTGGEFYGSIEGSVHGGAGNQGGAGVTISPLRDSSAVLISGDIQGGSGTSIGGHALNLYDLSGNAYVTVAGRLTGGDGFIGGDGIQLVSAQDNVSVGVSGAVKGGAGSSHGGSALILMNAVDASSFNLSGSFSGGDAIGSNAQPGSSLLLVGDDAVVRARIDNCILEEGRHLSAADKPDVLLTPQPTAEPTQTPEPTPAAPARPEITPLPEITSPADNIAYIITPEPPASDAE